MAKIRNISEYEDRTGKLYIIRIDANLLFTSSRGEYAFLHFDYIITLSLSV
ncbi:MULTISPECIES: hypothetical protein [Parabacteroides]|uniref:hypothetical protein n=1 Tax=Parabacteroides leei TaxID=2939491 RepID=UPI00189A1788|nr:MULTISPECIES: hypothetical protein [Parabacteroides]MCL3852779.1 hypothetical protein [Parabacteroides leei]